MAAVAIFYFNPVGCECQLGNLAEAKTRLQRAFEIEPKYRLKVLEDEDLEPLWESLGA
jgi:Tfp pilus assembly protein PilF